MNHLRISRGTFRYFEPLVRQQCIHTPRVISRSQQPWQSCRALSLPPKHNVIPLRRPYSQLTDSKQEPTTEQTSESEDRWANTPAYEMTFTCKQCNTRSSHKVSKQGYHHGTVLITCPGCKNKHLISDHMKIFSDKGVTLEDIMKKKGQLVKRGTLSTDGDVEFWDDGTEVQRDAKNEGDAKA